MKRALRKLFPWRMTVYFLDGDVQESYHPSLDEANTQADLTRNDYGSAVDHIDTVNVEMR